MFIGINLLSSGAVSVISGSETVWRRGHNSKVNFSEVRIHNGDFCIHVRKEWENQIEAVIPPGAVLERMCKDQEFKNASEGPLLFEIMKEHDLQMIMVTKGVHAGLWVGRVVGGDVVIMGLEACQQEMDHIVESLKKAGLDEKLVKCVKSLQ